MSEKTEWTKLDPKRTWIPMSVGVSVLIALLTFQIWLNRELTSIQTQLQLLRTNNEHAAKDAWTRSDMHNWSYQLKEMNTELRVPNPGALRE